MVLVQINTVGANGMHRQALGRMLRNGRERGKSPVRSLRDNIIGCEAIVDVDGDCIKGRQVGITPRAEVGKWSEEMSIIGRYYPRFIGMSNLA